MAKSWRRSSSAITSPTTSLEVRWAPRPTDNLDERRNYKTSDYINYLDGDVNSSIYYSEGEAAYDDGRIYRLATRPRPIARNFVHHQATLYRRTVFQEHGGFDATLRIMADYDFNLRLWKSRVRFRSLALRLAICGTGGLSDRGGWLGYREEWAGEKALRDPVEAISIRAIALGEGMFGELAGGFDELRIVHRSESLHRSVGALAADHADFA